MVNRRFPFGTEWVYVKIYSGPQTLERALINEIRDLIRDLLDTNIIEKFFFIRYSDDGHHLRFRFKLYNLDQLQKVTNTINKVIGDLFAQKLVTNFTYNVYNRELERYGVVNIEDCESTFFYSSYLVLEVLKHLSELSLENDRWIWGCKTIDMLLNDFNIPLDGKSKFMDQVVKGYSEEYNLTKLATRKLNDKYRDCSKEIEAVLNQDLDDIGVKLPDKLNAQYKFAINNLSIKHDQGILNPNLSHLLISLIHMHLNRLFQTQQRKNEFVLSFIMNKYYKSQIARQSVTL